MAVSTTFTNIWFKETAPYSISGTSCQAGVALDGCLDHFHQYLVQRDSALLDQRYFLPGRRGPRWLSRPLSPISGSKRQRLTRSAVLPARPAWPSMAVSTAFTDIWFKETAPYSISGTSC